MSTIVFQSLVSCFESHLTETTTTIKLKVAPPPPVNLDLRNKLVNEDCPPAEVKTNLEFGSWGFLQSTTKESFEKKSFYNTNPLTQYSSFSRLSAKSLELCTENLGSETGSDILSDSSISIFSSSPSFDYPSNSIDNSPSNTRIEFENSKPLTKSSTKPQHFDRNSRKKSNDFPPPLTTMSGSSSLQVIRHREGGRLIIEAVEAPFRNSYLQVERSDGRLRLCFLTCSKSAVTTSSPEEESDDECGSEPAEEEEIDETSREIQSEKEEFEGEMNLEMGREKFQRPSRCKESGHGNKGLCSNWKPALWVATSQITFLSSILCLFFPSDFSFDSTTLSSYSILLWLFWVSYDINFFFLGWIESMGCSLEVMMAIEHWKFKHEVACFYHLKIRDLPMM